MCYHCHPPKPPLGSALLFMQNPNPKIPCLYCAVIWISTHSHQVSCQYNYNLCVESHLKLIPCLAILYSTHPLILPYKTYWWLVIIVVDIFVVLNLIAELPPKVGSWTWCQFSISLFPFLCYNNHWIITETEFWFLYHAIHVNVFDLWGSKLRSYSCSYCREPCSSQYSRVSAFMTGF